MKVTQALTLQGKEAQQIKELIAKLQSPKARSFWEVRDYCKDYLTTAPFPDLNRLVFFIPTFQGKVGVIELPTDDPSPTTMFHIMNRPVADGRWAIAHSNNATNAELAVRKELGLLTSTPEVERITVPEYTCYPEDVNILGVTRQHLQVHGVTSRKRSLAERRLDPLNGGSFCSVCEARPIELKDGKYTTKGVSKGCAFVSTVDRLNDVWHGMYAALHVGGCSNTFFNYRMNSQSTPLDIFNFETDDLLFGPVYEQELIRSKDRLSLIDVFEWFTRMVIQTYGEV